MSYRLPPLQALRSFESGARYMSLKKAAAELNVTPAAVSQQVKSLEDYLGVDLFRRQGRGLELTAEGQAMLPKIREAFECIAAAVQATRNPEGTLSVMAPPTFAARWLVPRLQGFTNAHPEINFLLSSSLDAIDRQDEKTGTSSALIDPRDEDVEVAIRFGAGRCPGRRVDLVMASAYKPVCSPELLKGKHPLRVPGDLRWHTLIHDEAEPGEALRPSWVEWLRVAGITEIDSSLGQHFGNSMLALEAAIDGQGVVLSPPPLVAAEVTAGRLVIPFDISVTSPYFYYLATPEVFTDRKAVVAFRTWLIAEAAA